MMIIYANYVNPCISVYLLCSKFPKLQQVWYILGYVTENLEQLLSSNLNISLLSIAFLNRHYVKAELMISRDIFYPENALWMRFESGTHYNVLDRTSSSRFWTNSEFSVIKDTTRPMWHVCISCTNQQHNRPEHYGDVTMGAIASQITNISVVYSTVYSDADQRKHQSSASLAFVRGIHRGPVNSPHKWPVTRKMFPFDDVIM